MASIGGKVVEQEQSENADTVNKPRANYFLAFRITDTEIQSAAEEVQSVILEHEPSYKEFCMSAAALHVTFCSLGLDTPEQIERASQVLLDSHKDLQERCPLQPVQIHGVSNFFQKVIYAGVVENSAFLEYANYVKLCMLNAGVDVRDSHEFVPHMTILKVSGMAARKKGIKKVDSWMYKGCSDLHFGRQCIYGIHLCKMGNVRREDGFYVCPAEISFQA